jgi:outer membrane protein assembly factor BamB/nitrogen fixation-related uncharacterized protein
MTEEIKIKLSKYTAIFCGGFAIFISLLLLLNYWQMSSNEPLESKSIEILLERLEENPVDIELKKEIRNFDLLARKAYFNSQWQIRTGAFIILFACILMILSYRYYLSLTAKIMVPVVDEEDDIVNRLLSQRWIIAAGVFIILLAFLSAYKSNQYLDKYKSPESSDFQESSDIDEGIEIIEITEAGDSETVSSTAEITKTELAETISVEDLKELTDNKTDQEIMHTDETIQLQNSTHEKEILIDQDPKELVQNQPEVTFPSATVVRQNHNAFRGPFGNGISFHKNIPINWDAASGKNILWKIQVPKRGNNSPVIWGDKLFLAGGDKTRRMVFCINRHSGKILWQQEVKDIEGSSGQAPKTTDDTGLSAPTVCTDGIGVYAIFGTGDLIALDMDGNRLWAKSLGIPDNHYGHSSSLLSWKEKLFVQFDTNKGGKVLALNVKTGEQIWSTKRKSKISWASPILPQINGAYQLVLVSAPEVAGYHIESGAEIWSVDCLMGEVGASAAFGEGLIFASNEYAKLVAINPAKNYQIEWETDEYMPEVSSPVVSNGLLFIATSYGVLACYNAKSGEKHWEYEPGEGFYSSPMIVEGKLYISDMDGVTHVVKVDTIFSLISTSAVGEEVVATPAFASGRIYIRGKNHLYCIGQ